MRKLILTGFDTDRLFLGIDLVERLLGRHQELLQHYFLLVNLRRGHKVAERLVRREYLECKGD
jgi:hypothetical protein